MFRAVKPLCTILGVWIRVITHLSEVTECTTPRANPNVSCGLWVVVCRCRFIHCNKWPTLMGGVDDGGGCACVGAGGLWEVSGPSSQFCCEPQTVPKKYSLKKTRKKRHKCPKVMLMSC